MKVHSLGHVVLKVTDLKRSEAFYGGLLGMPVCARLDGKTMNMTFFSLGNHHDLAICEVSGEDAPAGARAAGLHHVAFQIGTSLDELKEAKAYLDASGIESHPVDHEVSKSLYINDPDGNMVELYVDVSDVWREDPQRVAQVKALAL